MRRRNNRRTDELLKGVFSRRLQEAMDLNGITQYDFDDQGVTTQHSISDYITGKALPMTPIMYEIAEFLGVSVDYLLGRTDDPYVSNDF